MNAHEGKLHIWFKCDSCCEGCMFCEGGLSRCTICGSIEGELLRFCPGFWLSKETRDAIYEGNIYDLELIRKYRNYAFSMIFIKKVIGK